MIRNTISNAEIDSVLDSEVTSQFTKEVCYTFARIIAIHKTDTETLTDTALRVYKKGYLAVTNDNFEKILEYLETEETREKPPFFGCNDE